MKNLLARVITLFCVLGISASSNATICVRAEPLSQESIRASLESGAIIAFVEVVSTNKGCFGFFGCRGKDSWLRAYSVSKVKVVEQFSGSSLDGKKLYSETATTAGIRLAPGYRYLVRPRKIDGEFRISLCSAGSIGDHEVKIELELLRSQAKER